MFDMEGLDGRCDDALTTTANFNAQPDSEPAHFQHTTAKSRTAHRRFDRFSEIMAALNEDFPVFRI